MEARFGRIILQQVDKALQEEPGRESLLSLLKIADPSFIEQDLSASPKRGSALRSLRLLIHPDKHQGDRAAATRRFQDTQAFYDDCVICLNARKRKMPQRTASSDALPTHFHVQDKWPLLAKISNHPVAPSNGTLGATTLEVIMGFKCINYRGAIIHGKRTELVYDYRNNVVKTTARSTSGVFSSFGGSKTLGSIEEIKKEIMLRGPVVSSSFHLTHAFLNAGDHAYAFEASFVNQSHAILIVGWKQTAFGEMWLARTSKSVNDIPIALGQFSIEDEVVAPSSDLSNLPWQNINKVYEVDDLPDDWYSWPAIETNCGNERLVSLFKVLGCSWAEALSRKPPFVIREQNKISRSRYAYLTDVKWIESEKEWKIYAFFCDQKWTK